MDDMDKIEGAGNRKQLLSFLSSVWPSHKSEDESNLSRSSSISKRESMGSRKNKGARNIGEGSFSLDDLEESYYPSKRTFTKDSPTDGEKTVQQYIPDLTFASEKRNHDFHKIFANYIPADEALIEDHSCALTREILLQGRFYITAHHACFHSNILGRATHLVVSYQEILEIKPKNTAGLFPNGIVIRSLHAQHTFASFVNREHVLKLLRRLKNSPLNNSAKDTSNEDSDTNSLLLSDSSSMDSDDEEGDWNEESSFKRKSYDSSFSFNSSGIGASEDEYSSTKAAPKNGRSRSSTRTAAERPLLSKRESKDTANNSPNENGGGSSSPKSTGGKWPVENLGPETHKPTSLPEPDSKEKLVDTSTVGAPLGVVANLLFGKDTSWYQKFQTNDLKNRDLESIPPFKDTDGKKQRYFEYIKPLNGPVGPKQTKCKVTESIEKWDFDDRIEVLIAVRTPDVPSGDSFVTYTKCCLAWAENDKTTVRHTTWLEWSGKSWLKKPIENGAMDGQIQYCKALNTALAQKLRSKSGASGKARKSRSKQARKTRPPASSSSTGSFDYYTIATYALYIFGTLLALFVMRSIYRYMTDGPSNHHRLLKEQLDLWQWLDSRLENKSSFHEVSGTLTTQEIEEVIKLTQLRLSRLQAIRNERVD